MYNYIPLRYLFKQFSSKAHGWM